MKEKIKTPLPPLDACCVCDKRLSHRDIEWNERCGVDKQDWVCFKCDAGSDPT